MLKTGSVKISGEHLRSPVTLRPDERFSLDRLSKRACVEKVDARNYSQWFSYYKDLYTRKYGKPTISKENNPAHLDSNTALMAEVHQGTVVYGSAWEVTGGDIQLSIEKSSGVYEGMVMIRYRDSQNIEAKIQNDLDDI